MSADSITLRRDENQALGLGRLAIDFLAGRIGQPGAAALARVEQFHLDSIACGVSALACGTNAPNLLRREALDYPLAAPLGATCLGSARAVKPEKAVAANCSAVREWDANGTNFGFNPARGASRGEFGHNDFYPVVVAAAQQRGLDGQQALRGMLLLDEIRGRLAEVFALREHKIDHVVHGAIASAAVYAALLGATAEQIESAIGVVVAHYIPFRAIRAGKQLSDSKGASAALSAEMAVVAAHRALRGFVGPADVFRNPEAIFCLFEPPPQRDCSPFDLTLTVSGDDFAVRQMHFKLGLYEHQSAGAIQAVVDLLEAHPALTTDSAALRRIRIALYQPALGIIADPAKRDPRTRQSADHSMVYIVATLLRKALERRATSWSELMLLPADYDDEALFHPLTRAIMQRIEVVHGGAEFDRRYPDGIPTQIAIEHAALGTLESPLVMYPEGHARCGSGQTERLLREKFARLAALGVADVDALYRRFTGTAEKSAAEIAAWNAFPIRGLADG